MGTNYTRIPTEDEMNDRKLQLIKDITEMSIEPEIIERGFNFPINDSWDTQSPWGKFIEGTSVHLGKRSSGWKFCWDLNDKKYYTNKEEMFAFIRSGRVVDEYGDLMDNEEFIKMALEWGEPDGYVYDKAYVDMEFARSGYRPIFVDDHYDIEIDGLRFSRSTDFC